MQLQEAPPRPAALRNLSGSRKPQPHKKLHDEKHFEEFFSEVVDKVAADVVHAFRF